MIDQETLESLDSFPKLTRVEVIDEKGRAYTNMSCEGVQISMQDGGRTLKVFLVNSNEE